jgi:hypothetical protein
MWCRPSRNRVAWRRTPTRRTQSAPVLKDSDSEPGTEAWNREDDQEERREATPHARGDRATTEGNLPARRAARLYVSTSEHEPEDVTFNY